MPTPERVAVRIRSSPRPRRSPRREDGRAPAAPRPGAGEAARPYALRMERVLPRSAAGMAGQPGAPRCWRHGRAMCIWMVVATSTAGLRWLQHLDPAARRAAPHPRARQCRKTVKILTVGRKGRDSLRRDYGG